MKKNNEEFIVKFFDAFTPKRVQEEVEKRLDKQERETTKIMNILFAVVLVLIFMLAAVLVDVWLYKADSYQGWMEVLRKENLTEENQELQANRFDGIEKKIGNIKESIDQLSNQTTKPLSKEN